VNVDGLQDLISCASIKIYEYGIDKRTEMKCTDRVFPFYVMSYLSEGSAVLRIDGQEYRLEPRSVVIIPANVRHNHYKVTDEQSVFLWWHFDYKVYDTVDMLKLFRLPIVHNIKDSRRFESLFNNCNNAMGEQNSVKNSFHRLACILEVLGNLLEEIGENGDESRFADVPNAFKEMLETIVSGDVNQLTLSFFAEKYNMHPTYISNRFSEYFGIPPIKLYRKIQMERAGKLLESGEKTVGEVAEMFGFSDVSVFSRLFKSVKGVSPSNLSKRDVTQSGVMFKNL